MYNPKFTMGENIAMFEEKVGDDINTLRERYENDPKKYADFRNEMAQFAINLKVVALSENPEVFNVETKKIEKYLKEELKRSR